MTEDPILPGIDPESLKTEQEKDTSAPTPGVGPTSAAEPSPGPAETIEEQGIGPRTPYPTGAPEGEAPLADDDEE